MANSTNHKSQIGSKERLLDFIFGRQFEPALLHQKKKKSALEWYFLLKLSQIINVNKYFCLLFPC